MIEYNLKRVESIVNRILRNETYTGTLIQNIKTKQSYRSDKLIDVNKDEITKKLNIEQLDRKILNEIIHMIYIIDKDNIKIELKNV